MLVTTLRVAVLTKIPEMESKDADEILALQQALDAYAEKYGEYPPDFTSGNPRQEINEHLQRVFPDRDAKRDVPKGIDKLGPDNALAFWLQGFYRDNTRFPLTGKLYLGRHPLTGEEVWVDMAEVEVVAEVFDGNSVSWMTSNKIVPVNGVGAQRTYENLFSNYGELAGLQLETKQRTTLHKFDVQRLSKRDAYRPRCCDAPLVYFRAQSYPFAHFSDRPKWGIANPYQAASMDGTTSFIRPQGFQIICAGRDSLFGLGSVAVADAAFHEGHADNFTNFAITPLGTQRMLARRQKVVLARNLSPFVAVICLMLYPVVMALRRNDDGTVALARIIKNQICLMDCSDAWTRELNTQKRCRRDRAIRRLQTSATEADS